MSFRIYTVNNNFEMKLITGYEALRMMEDISKMQGDFTICFYKYSRKNRRVATDLKTYSKCRTRGRLPKEKFNVDGENLLLFETNGENKMCYKLLIRYVGFSTDGYELRKIKWV